MERNFSQRGAIDLTLYVACYNEEENIAVTLDTLLAALEEVDCSWEIIVIDDASRDRSVEVIRKYQTSHPGLPIRLVVNECNKGLGFNYDAAAALGKGTYYRLICGDNSEPRETFVKVFRQLGAADIIIPHHVYCPGKSLFRRMLSRTYTTLVNLISGHRLHYYNGLAVHIRENVLRCAGSPRGLGFQADILTRLLDEGSSYVEVPVAAQERTKGRSTVLTLKNFLSVARTLSVLFGRRLKRSFRHPAPRPARGAVPVASSGESHESVKGEIS
jgi:glycosyltransferase involved in cell wall biosynthesis